MVEDDEIVRNVAVRVLKDQGYRVLSTRHPEEALETLEKHGRPVDLIVTDVIMPGGTGVELVEQVARIHPETKSLFISGYVNRAIFAQDDQESPIHFLAKPFTAEELARRVREILDLG